MPANPLSQEQIDELKAAQELIPVIKEQIALAKSAGIDMKDREAELIELQDKVSKLLRVYGPMPTLPKLTGE